MTDNNDNGGLPPEVTPLPGATPPAEIDLDNVVRSNAVEYLERLLEWFKEHEKNGHPVRSVVVAVNGVAGLWTFSNTTDVAEQCTLLRIALETKQRTYVGLHTSYQQQELAKLARQKEAEQKGDPNNVVPISSPPAAISVPPPGTFRLVDFHIGEPDDGPPEDGGDDPGPIAA